VPTNVISITDGQIFLETTFNAASVGHERRGLGLPRRRCGSDQGHQEARGGVVWRWPSTANWRHLRSLRPIWIEATRKQLERAVV